MDELVVEMVVAIKSVGEDVALAAPIKLADVNVTNGADEANVAAETPNALVTAGDVERDVTIVCNLLRMVALTLVTISSEVLVLVNPSEDDDKAADARTKK